MLDLGTKARPMKLQKLLLLVTAIGLAVAPAWSRAQEPPYPDPYAGQGVPYGPGMPYAEDTTCYDGSCGCCSHCTHRMDVFGSIEYLMWWGKGTPLPPLVTTSPPGTPQGQAGVLGQPGTEILFGDELVGDEIQFGARINWGIWLDRDHNIAATGSFFALGGDNESFISDPSIPIVARPFFNAPLGIPDALLISFPGLTQGRVNVQAETDNIMSAEANLEIMMDRERCYRSDIIAGYRFFRLDDSLRIDSFSTVTELGGLLPQGTTFDLSDRFAAENEFHGGTLGYRSEMSRGRWSLHSLIKASFGSARQHVSIAGEGNINIPPGVDVPLNGGFLALPTNIGEFERSRFVVIPELTVNLAYHFSPNVNLFVGYNFIWISEVVLSGDQIDNQLNLSQQTGPLVGPARPQFEFVDQNYWLQGLNFGASWEF